MGAVLKSAGKVCIGGVAYKDEIVQMTEYPEKEDVGSDPTFVLTYSP